MREPAATGPYVRKDDKVSKAFTRETDNDDEDDVEGVSPLPVACPVTPDFRWHFGCCPEGSHAFKYSAFD